MRFQRLWVCLGWQTSRHGVFIYVFTSLVDVERSVEGGDGRGRVLCGLVGVSD